MNKYILSIAVLFIGCYDNNDDIETGAITVTTSNVADGTWYFNLQSNSIDTNTWHISLQNISVDPNYPSLPSIVLSDTVMVSVVENQQFDDIITSPETNTFTANTDIVSLFGTDEILHYDFDFQTGSGTHQILVSNKIYFIYDIITHRTYKLNFQEYSSGILLFQYIEMDL